MLRKFALVAIAAIGLGAASIGISTPAQAAPPGAGYGFIPHSHGGHGGWRGGGWHRRGGYGGGWGGGWGWGAPLYGFYGDPYYYDDYGYAYCRYRTVRIHTRYGWRWIHRRICW